MLADEDEATAETIRVKLNSYPEVRADTADSLPWTAVAPPALDTVGRLWPAVETDPSDRTVVNSGPSTETCGTTSSCLRAARSCYSSQARELRLVSCKHTRSSGAPKDPSTKTVF